MAQASFSLRIDKFPGPAGASRDLRHVALAAGTTLAGPCVRLGKHVAPVLLRKDVPFGAIAVPLLLRKTWNVRPGEEVLLEWSRDAPTEVREPRPAGGPATIAVLRNCAQTATVEFASKHGMLRNGTEATQMKLREGLDGALFRQHEWRWSSSSAWTDDTAAAETEDTDEWHRRAGAPDPAHQETWAELKRAPAKEWTNASSSVSGVWQEAVATSLRPSLHLARHNPLARFLCTQLVQRGEPDVPAEFKSLRPTTLCWPRGARHFVVGTGHGFVLLWGHAESLQFLAQISVEIAALRKAMAVKRGQSVAEVCAQLFPKDAAETIVRQLTDARASPKSKPMPTPMHPHSTSMSQTASSSSSSSSSVQFNLEAKDAALKGQSALVVIRDRPRGFAFGPDAVHESDGAVLAMVDEAGMVRIMTSGMLYLSNGEPEHAHASPGLDLAWDPEGRFLVTAARGDPVLKWWEWLPAKQQLRWRADQRVVEDGRPVLSLDWSAGGLVVALDGNTMCLWRRPLPPLTETKADTKADTKVETKTPKSDVQWLASGEHRRKTEMVRWNAAGTLLAERAAGVLRVWRMPSAKDKMPALPTVCARYEQTAPFTSMAWNPRVDLLVTGDVLSCLKFWDVASSSLASASASDKQIWHPVAELSRAHMTRRGDARPIRALAFHPSGYGLVTTDGEREFLVWRPPLSRDVLLRALDPATDDEWHRAAETQALVDEADRRRTTRPRNAGEDSDAREGEARGAKRPRR
jgi:WD40 repeat protein